ncbi:hypothetical protein Pmani_012484 [Petrolisthes manimaculis]|uniref:Uncharacterized protein n=1 Tax=Petrolisthes manimaculis TaxID=1843537 RepID=A0AAE1UEL5_9EUCA|nr:hypothetical protein Pmani_012484 [Petrolisthes manimaculis]
MRYRLSKEAVRDLLREITPRLQRIRNNRGCSVPHQLQLLVALRYMASGNFQITMVLHNIAISRRIPIEEGFENPEVGEHYHGEGEAHNAAGGPYRRQALIERWF